MKIKDKIKKHLYKNNGITGIDIVSAIIIVMMFTGLISNMFYNIESSKRELSRAQEATNIAIKVIEEIKQKDYEELPKSENSSNTIEELQEEMSQKFGLNGYTITLQMENYKEIKNDDSLKDCVQTLDVKVSYLSNNKERNIEMKTAIIK